MKLTQREKSAIVFLAALAALTTVMWRPVSQRLLTHLLLRADAVSEDTVDELADQYSDPTELLQRLWNSGKIPHRLAVVNYLDKRPAAALLPKLQTILIEGSGDVDFEVRELALRLLARQSFPGLSIKSKQQLRDADPAVRLLGLEHLRRGGNPKLLPMLVPLLDDPDPSVQASAGNLLQKWSGHDFGIRLSQALPQFSLREPKEPEPDKVELLRGEVALAKVWWAAHRADFGPSPGDKIVLTSARRLRTADFTMRDVDERPVHLSDFRGKSVLLNFWDTATPACKALITNLTQVAQSKSEGLIILGISLETTVALRDHKHEHEGEHAHHHHSHIAPDLAQVRTRIRSFVEQSGIRYPVLVDADGLIAQRYAAEDLPTTVLIDGQGLIRRRFIGVRSTEALRAILRESEPPRAN